MNSETKSLILTAEREAQMVSATARLIMIVVFIAIIFSIGGPPSPAVWTIVLSYLLFYAFVSVFSILMALPRFFRPWWGIMFAVVDGATLAVLISFVLRGVGLPPSHHSVVPGFILFFPILMLATMRYTIAPIVVGFASFAFTSLAFLGFADSSAWTGGSSLPAQVDPNFMFRVPQNIARWLFVAATAGLGLLAVRRRRAMLVSAISLGQKTANLSRYLPEPVARLVAEQGMDALSRGRRQNAAILFVDIRGFTAFSEHTPPEELGTLLSEFRLLVLRQVEEHSGIVDKFIGDAVMAVFGVPDSAPGDPENGMQCARAISEELVRWNADRQTNGQAPVAIAMGVHYGEVFAGAVGSEARMEFTVLGDTVNVASRLQEAAKSADYPLVVSEAMFEAAGVDPNAEVNWVAMPDTAIRGRHGDVPHYGSV